jgi:transcriptional regulator with XRE-family HTH domain
VIGGRVIGVIHVSYVSYVIAFDKMNDTFLMVHEPDRAQLRETLAANLRRLRIARHLSLSELARATSMSKGTLSGIENGRANPTVETLALLAGAMRVPIAELLEEPPFDEIRIVRAVHGDGGVRDALHRPLDALPAAGAGSLSELTLPGRHQQEEPALPAGSRIHLFVLEGTLIAGPAARYTELGTGDYISFPADVPHVLETIGGRGARALVLTQSPGR